MRNDRRTILSLVALGRITPGEAERLLIAWNEGREGLWIFVACIAAALLAQVNPQQGVEALKHIAHALLPGGSLHHAVALVTRLWGGMQ
jgi:hypothetical protein